jgi:hypothetical protein
VVTSVLAKIFSGYVNVFAALVFLVVIGIPIGNNTACDGIRLVCQSSLSHYTGWPSSKSVK